MNKQVALSLTQPWATPIPAKGHLGLWDCSEYLEGKDLDWRTA